MTLRKVQISLIFVCLLCINGCATYHVKPSNIGKEKAVSRIDSLMKSHFNHWPNKSKYKAGANQYFFYNGQAFSRDGNQGALVASYSEIIDVSVSFNPLGLLTFGLADPTSWCKVNLLYDDYTFSRFRCIGYANLFPFYLFSPNWITVHRAARAFEELRLQNDSD